MYHMSDDFTMSNDFYVPHALPRMKHEPMRLDIDSGTVGLYILINRILMMTAIIHALFLNK